jgi:isopenicillin N synthase-like dioxygenase
LDTDVTTTQLPVLDLGALDGDSRVRADFLARLRQAAREVGFFYVRNHGVPRELNERALASAIAFFALPEAEKQAIAMVRSPHFRGYTRAGGEITRGRPDWREQIDVGAEREALPRRPGAPAWTRLQGPNQWPASLPEFLRRGARAAGGQLRLDQRGRAAPAGQGDPLSGPHPI